MRLRSPLTTKRYFCHLKEIFSAKNYLSTERSGFQIDEQPFVHDQVDVTDVAFQRKQRLLVPVYIPCSSDSHARIVPLSEIFLGKQATITCKAGLSGRCIGIGVVHILLVKEAAKG